MKKITRYFAFILALSLVLIPMAAALDVVEPNASFYVADYADVLSEDTENYIVTHNNSLYSQSGAQIVVVVLDFLDGADIE